MEHTENPHQGIVPSVNIWKLYLDLCSLKTTNQVFKLKHGTFFFRGKKNNDDEPDPVFKTNSFSDIMNGLAVHK